MLLERLQDLPLSRFTRFLEWVRRRGPFKYDWRTDVDAVYVDTSPEHLDAVLRGDHWEDPRPYALVYRGEVNNLRRPAGVLPDGTPAEDHIRARRVQEGVHEGMLEVIGHHEASRFEAKEAHVHNEGLEWYGAEELAPLLEASGLTVVDFEIRT
jgi:hypothetical protein